MRYTQITNTFKPETRLNKDDLNEYSLPLYTHEMKNIGIAKLWLMKNKKSIIAKSFRHIFRGNNLAIKPNKTIV